MKNTLISFMICVSLFCFLAIEKSFAIHFVDPDLNIEGSDFNTQQPYTIVIDNESCSTKTYTYNGGTYNYSSSYEYVWTTSGAIIDLNGYVSSNNSASIAWKKHCGSGWIKCDIYCLYYNDSTKTFDNDLREFLATKQETVTFTNPPTPTDWAIGDNVSIPCNKTNTIELCPNPRLLDNDLIYNWSTPAGYTINGGNNSECVTIVIPPGSTTEALNFQLKIKYPGCPEVVKNIQLHRTGPVSISIGSSLTIPCNKPETRTICLEDLPDDPNYTYVWNTGGYVFRPASTTGNPYHCIEIDIPCELTSRTISLTLTAGSGCETTTSITITRTPASTENQPTRPCFCHNETDLIKISTVDGAIDYDIVLESMTSYGWDIQETAIPGEFLVTPLDGAENTTGKMVIITCCGIIEIDLKLDVGPPSVSPDISISQDIGNNGFYCDKEVKFIDISYPNSLCDGTYMEYELFGNFCEGGDIPDHNVTISGTSTDPFYADLEVAGHGSVKARFCNKCGCGPWTTKYIWPHVPPCPCDINPDCEIMWKTSIPDEEGELNNDDTIQNDLVSFNHNNTTNQITILPINLNNYFSFDIFNLNGEVIYEGKNVKNQQIFNTEQLATGLYTVRVLINEKVYNFKFVIVK